VKRGEEERRGRGGRAGGGEKGCRTRRGIIAEGPRSCVALAKKS